RPGRAPALLAKRDGRGAEPVRLLPGPARAEDAARAHGTPHEVGGGARGSARGPPGDRARALPRLELAPAVRARPAPDARPGRHGEPGARRGRAGGAALPASAALVRA